MISDTILRKLEAELDAGGVDTSDAALDERRHDYWVLKHLRNWRGEKIERPGVVVRPKNTAQVQAIVRVAAEGGIPLVPFGLGSGVCGGIEPDESCILVDLSTMNRVREIDETNLVASFDAGCNGLEAEEAVAERGLTIGHWPQSIAVSSVGGWVSTRAAGQFSTGYGNIEDMVYAIEVVLPNGELVTLGKAPRAAAGPDLRHLVMGAEGTMGIVSGVTLSLRRQAEKRAFTAFHTPTLAAGFEAQRQIVQNEWLPPVMRQYDVRESQRNFQPFHADDQGLLLMMHEGPASRVDAELEAVEGLASKAGLARGSDEAGPHWMERRNHVPTWTDLLEQNLIVDTIEVSAPWTRIEGVYDDVCESVLALDPIRLVSAHSSHVYRTGLNLYFTFVALHEDSAEMEGTYREVWRRTLEATAKNGGGIAHHHGVGRLRKNELHHDLGENGLALLRTLKGAIDPQGLMNPGNLIPDA